MPPLTVGDRAYRIRSAQRGDRWTAHAVRVDNGDRYGVDVWGESEREVVEAVTRWLGWQHAHAAALETLQAAERAYHRSVAGHAFASQAEEPAIHRERREALARVEHARAWLDDVRRQRPAS